MYLVEDRRNGTINLVFTWDDPRKAGYQGKVIEGVTLDYNMDAVHHWPEGQARPDACVGRSPVDSRHYQVFQYDRDLRAAGYELVAGTAAVFGAWKDYLKVSGAEDLSDEEWYQQLDRYDEAARLRRQRGQEPTAPAGSSRDEIAAWVARRHLIVDAGIREVWYLPRQAPPEEIRLLELSDRLAGAEPKTEPIDFGLDVEGAKFKLLVADITSDQLNRIRQDPSHLPPGWSLEESKIWRRGA
ncbi:MAG: hypothetical protein JNM56_14650 [Planctomycetia bacterium]|nr:hypothetical protein [Planctomycetia bacterium]